MSRIIDFYRGKGTDGSGRTIDEVLRFDNIQMERVHDSIQWLFPLPEPSKAQPQSPVATQEDYEAFKSDPVLLGKLKHAANRMHRFYDETTGWKRQRDHNHRRITRILQCLTLCGLSLEATLFMNHLLRGSNLPKVTRDYWEDALQYDPWPARSSLPSPPV